MRRLVLGTAGHIDHGKTALVRALTGVDTDRLPEEKRRGITIDLGFARLIAGDGCEIGIVDVPGHEAFVRNMLAGATGIDMVLLVIAADEGVMPQTREHLAIVELLGIRRGVVALTRTDLVDDEWLDLARDDARDLLAGSGLAGAPLIPVSAVTGQGIETLRDALTAAAAATPLRAADDLFRMPIDRVFTVHGTGTVVTGTVWSGTLRRDAQVRIEPAGMTARVRTVHRHGAEAEAAGPGERAALALAGLDRDRLRRGDTVVSGTGWHTADVLTVRLAMARGADRPLRTRQRVRVHLGTAEAFGRVVLFDDRLEHGGTALAQLRLETPVLGRAGDHVVIRSFSPVITIAGGVVLEPAAPRRKRLAPSARAALAVVTDAAGPAAALALAGSPSLSISDLPVLTGLTPAAVRAAVAADRALLLEAERIMAAETVARCRDAMVRRVREHHAACPLDDGIDRETLRRADGVPSPEVHDVALRQLLDEGALVSHGPAMALPGFVPRPTPELDGLAARLADVFSRAGLQAPTPEELPADLARAPALTALLKYLERQGRLVRTGTGRWTDAAALLDATAALRSQLPVGTPLDLAVFRDALGLSRKHLIPLLEYLDRAAVTRRDGDRRVVLPDARLVV